MQRLMRQVMATFTVAVLACATHVFASDRDGKTTLTGIAVDASGGALPGVTVTLKAGDGSPSEAQEQVTDGDGRFTFEDVGPGTYSVMLTLSGFEDKKFDTVTVPSAEELKAVMQIAGLTETVVVRPEPAQISIPVAPIGAAVIEQQVLANVPLANERFEDALPLLPGVVRGPDGLLNMNGARADQSAFFLNGVNMTDPVTGHFAVRLPLEAIESANVQAGVHSAAFGNASGGVTDVVIRPGQDDVNVQVQNLMPRLRFAEGSVRGIDSFTPRIRISGPIERGRIWFSEAVSYRFVRSRIDELEPLDKSEQKVNSFDSVSQIDAILNPSNHLTATLVAFPSNIDNVGIDTLHPYDATPDMKQRGWISAISERAILNDSTTLATSFAVKQYDMNVAPKHEASSFVTVEGARGNYFNHFDRDSRRYDAGLTLAIATPNAWGQHLTEVGGQFAHTSYDGIDAGGPVVITRANGTALRRIDYLGNPAVGATNTELAGFVEDQWAVASQLTIHSGARYAYDQISGQQTIAPRIDGSLRLFANGGTVVKAGIGRLYDKLPLNSADFAAQQARRMTDYDEQGNTTAVSVVSNRIADDGLRSPATTAWNVEVDQMLSRSLQARVGYRHRSGSDQLVVDPQAADGALTLSSTGRSQSQEFEATVRRQFGNASHITASYVHSSTQGDLNDFVSLFGDLRDPVIHGNEYGRQSFDSPNRFLVWGVMNLPHAIAVAPTLEYRTGFPYTIVDEQQNVVGVRNQVRFPNLFTLDLAVTKDVQLPRLKRARVGVQLFNLTNHSNPQDVQNNTASAAFGQFANSVDRQVRGKFTLLF